MNLEDFDVVIGGAGPAGSSAAIILAKAGYKVALADDVNKKQWKVGESLPAAAIRLLRRLGIPDMDHLMGPGTYKNCVANASAWKSDQWTYKDALMNPEGGGWHLMRHLFDEALRQKAIEAGAHLLSARVHDIIPLSPTGFKVELKPHPIGGPKHLQAKWLIDATGRNTVIARRQGVEKERIDSQLAAYSWLIPHEGDVDNTTRIKSVPDGWWYTSRLPNSHRIIAFHGTAKMVSRMTKNVSFFLTACNQTDLIPYAVQLTPSHLRGPVCAHDAGVSKLLQPFGNRWLAIGDAALSFDPFLHKVYSSPSTVAFVVQKRF